MRVALRIIATSILSLAALVSGARADIIQGSQKNVQGWTLDAHDVPGKGFSHCTIFVPYRSGITMIFAITASRHWSVGWLHPSWSLRPGQPVQLRFSIDGAGPYNLSATAKNRTLVSAELPDNASIFDMMRQGHQMTLYAPNAQLGFSLNGTNAALSELSACVDRFTQPGASPSPPPAQSAPPPSSPQPSAEAKGAAETAGLPLKPGFYMPAGTPCGNASFATLWSVDPSGVTIGHEQGPFKRIEKIGPNKYRVTLELFDPRNANPSVDTTTDVYVITSPTSFRVGDAADADEMRFCPTSSLPPPWRR